MGKIKGVSECSILIHISYVHVLVVACRQKKACVTSLNSVIFDWSISLA